jgi:hypothetical protein
MYRMSLQKKYSSGGLVNLSLEPAAQIEFVM